MPDRGVMTPATVSLFYALLALVANGVVVAIIALALAGRLDAVRELLGGTAITGALLVAVLALAGSLYFSEVARYEPCTLCWYQRIAMYPLVVVLGVAAWQRDAGVARYVLPLAGIGAAIAAYHYALEWFPALDSGVCSASTPCSVVWFRELGFISIPYLALSAFALIGALVWVGRDARIAERGS